MPTPYRGSHSLVSRRAAPTQRTRHSRRDTASLQAVDPTELSTRRSVFSEDATSPEDSTVHFRPQPKPLWLTVLQRAHQGSAVLTLLLVAAVLMAYGWTVYIQQRWGQAYDKLETYKKQERQLISANEVLKNQMADQAESPTAGLLLPDPSNAIFLAPAPQRPAVKPKSTAPAAKPAPTKPLGY